MLLTLSEAKAAIGGSPTDEEAINLAAGVSDALRAACNRVFPSVIESVAATTGSLVTVTSYHHGLVPGDRIRVNTRGGGSGIDLLDATVGSGGLTRDKFEVDANVSAFDPVLSGGLTFRKVITEVMRTCGQTSVFVQWRPLESILGVSLINSEGTWDAVAEADYAVPDLTSSLSMTGEVELLRRSFPTGTNGRKCHPTGAKIVYVSGDRYISPSLLYAMKGLLEAAERRRRIAGFQSESYDYYSYSRLSAAEVGQLFGEADRIIAELRIPV